MGRPPWFALAVLVGVTIGVRERRAEVPFFAAYRDADEISAYLHDLAARRPGQVRFAMVGRSVEGAPIEALAIVRGDGEHRHAVVIDGGLHAREWISVMTATCLAARIAGDDALLARADFAVLPLANPDGYRYSWAVDRTWRKSRAGAGSAGVDLNRNFPVGFGGADSSGDPRASTYRGTHPFSEPEVRAVRALFEQTPDVAAHVDLHAFSQVITYPWSYQRTPPPPADRARFATAAAAMRDAMTATHGTPYTIRPGEALRVGAGGTVADWSYATYGALAFLVELRPASSADGGFELPPDEIAPTCDEAFAAVRALTAQLDSAQR